MSKENLPHVGIGVSRIYVQVSLYLLNTLKVGILLNTLQNKRFYDKLFDEPTYLHIYYPYV